MNLKLSKMESILLAFIFIWIKNLVGNILIIKKNRTLLKHTLLYSIII